MQYHNKWSVFFYIFKTRTISDIGGLAEIKMFRRFLDIEPKHLIYVSIGVEAQKLSDHPISIGGRSLIVDKNLYF